MIYAFGLSRGQVELREADKLPGVLMTTSVLRTVKKVHIWDYVSANYILRDEPYERPITVYSVDGGKAVGCVPEVFFTRLTRFKPLLGGIVEVPEKFHSKLLKRAARNG